MTKITLAERLESALNQNAELTATVDAATAKVGELEQLSAERGAKIAELTAALSASEESLKGATEKIAALQAAFDQHKAESEAAIAAERAKLSLKAFGDIGGGTAPVADGGEAVKQQSLLEQFAAITDPAARHKFYRENVSKLTQEACK